MSYMFEVYYRAPANTNREAALTAKVIDLGGKLSFREASNAEERGSICLTYEFTNRAAAERAASALREMGEHVEGPVEYGPRTAMSD